MSENEKRFVYADNAATTQVSRRVYDAMLPWIRDGYGNPSSLYSIGRESRRAVENARGQVATALGASENEIYFTSCGSESDNWAVKGTARALRAGGRDHIVTSAIEHHALLRSCKALEKEGFSVTYLPVDEYGLVSPDALEQAITDRTALVSVMYANNEIGTIEPVRELAAAAHRHGVLFHTDAVQAVGHEEIDVKALDVDMLSLSGHKFRAPKGIGALYVRKGVRPDVFLDGGGQEMGRRGGTENISGIVGLGEAITAACEDIPGKNKRVAALRDRLIAELTKLPYTRLNGHPALRLAGNVNLSFRGVEGESMLLLLDAQGICASTGSACASGSLDPSHVLLAIGLPHEVAHGSLRLSLGEETTAADVDYILAKLPPIVERLRAMSPVWEEIVGGKN